MDAVHNEQKIIKNERFYKLKLTKMLRFSKYASMG